MKILITGFFGAGNFGDDIMLDVFYKHCKEKFPDDSFELLRIYGGGI